jgi:rubrerythrin
MNLPDSNKKACTIIDKLAINEESIAKLYRGYADAFPILREFWSSLASDESGHASCIRSLGRQIGTPSLFMDENRFTATAIQTFAGYLDRELSRLKEGEIPLTEALSITLYIEQSLIESRFFELFRADSAELQHTLAKLRDETLAHRNRAKETLEKHKQAERVKFDSTT